LKNSDTKKAIAILEDRLARISFDIDQKQEERQAVKREIERLQGLLLDNDPYP